MPARISSCRIAARRAASGCCVRLDECLYLHTWMEVRETDSSPHRTQRRPQSLQNRPHHRLHGRDRLRGRQRLDDARDALQHLALLRVLRGVNQRQEEYESRSEYAPAHPRAPHGPPQRRRSGLRVRLDSCRRLRRARACKEPKKKNVSTVTRSRETRESEEESRYQEPPHGNPQCKGEIRS
jgi:hypothetical protein